MVSPNDVAEYWLTIISPDDSENNKRARKIQESKMSGKTFEAGHFHKHNEAVVNKLKSITDLKEAVRTYVTQVVDDGIALHHAGASDGQIADSRKALLAKFDVAWEAMTAGTSHQDTGARPQK